MTSFKIKFLHLVGFAPRLDSCGRCGKHGYLSTSHRGRLCAKDAAQRIDSPVKISPAAVKFYSDLLTWDIMKVNRIRPSGELLAEISNLIAMHIRYILSKPLKTESFASKQSHLKIES